jgi:fatty acid desaturase
VTYVLALGVPALFATWSMMFTNYLQHVRCDPNSRDNHSRNFVAPWVNWLVFDAGYHTVHHENPSVHWSRYRELHQRRGAAIDPNLNRHSILSYCITHYLLGALRRAQVGRDALLAQRRAGSRTAWRT